MANPRLMKPAQSYQVGYEVSIRGPRERVWSAFVDEPTNWWPQEFYSAENPTGFVIEKQLGGKVYETWEGGGGSLWGQIILWLPGYRMVWACDLFAEHTGPGRSFVTFDLTDAAGGTLVTVQDTGICTNAAQAGNTLGSAWQRLIGVHLKNYIETALWSNGLSDSGRLNVRLDPNDSPDAVPLNNTGRRRL